MATFGLHAHDHNEPQDYEWFDTPAELFQAWRTKEIRFLWSGVIYAEAECIAGIGYTPNFGYYPVGYVRDGVDMLAKYGLHQQIQKALTA